MIWKPEEMESVACDFCGTSNSSRKFSRGDGMSVVECRLCGLAYLQPRPRKEYISRFYDADYFTGVSAASGKGGLRCLAESNGQETRIPRSLALMKEKVGVLPGKKILEIGCATGEFLELLTREGADAEGLEISEFAAEIARKKGLEVTTGTIEEMGNSTSPFDMILAFEVIEHVPSPVAFLEQVAGLIRSGGHLLLSTPNYACGQRYGDQWYGFTGSFEHIYYFSKDVLERMARQAGLVLTYWETTMHSGDNSRKPGFLDRRIDWFGRFADMSRAVGLPLALSLARQRSLNYLPYGNGHKITVVFRKDDSC
ncbi:methyltransferase domain-containing protein [Geobacter pelophilus]|uniref:Methyltransferase domain-containing protein n=1 Tax=Geoanaerobacter pelophilus TaxID=60036 RepID=A0AAW4L5K1_9BACT|nr:class I SAM-dependent methyltransferase [Geoanaerobacter pelophilus]MBT0666178.1 methyltransferase domain-containing protein [Geoanaerobacter pelophilus]